jgi:hypothetical protein
MHVDALRFRTVARAASSMRSVAAPHAPDELLRHPVALDRQRMVGVGDGLLLDRPASRHRCVAYRCTNSRALATQGEVSPSRTPGCDGMYQPGTIGCRKPSLRRASRLTRRRSSVRTTDWPACWNAFNSARASASLRWAGVVAIASLLCCSFAMISCVAAGQFTGPGAAVSCAPARC